AEQLIAAAGIVAHPAARTELAEDLTARALARCLPLLERDGVPEHIRAWTSAPVLEAEAELTAPLAARSITRAAAPELQLTCRHRGRWTDDGAWTRLDLDQIQSADVGQLLPGDLLVIDEAGMLDQDTARALLTLADERRLRIALLGDRHQLPAVGRGGVLDLA